MAGSSRPPPTKASPLCASRASQPAEPDTKAGSREPGTPDRPGRLPNSRRRALTPSRRRRWRFPGPRRLRPPRPLLPQESAAAGLASCSASCASASPPRGQWARGSRAQRAGGLRGGSSRSSTTWPRSAGPADLEPAGAGREVLTILLPFPSTPHGPQIPRVR